MMEKLPLSSTKSKKPLSYDATKVEDGTSRLKEIPENAEEHCVSSGTECDSSFAAKFKRRKWKRRQSSEGAFIHITGTGTLCEETLKCKDCYKGDTLILLNVSSLKLNINLMNACTNKNYFCTYRIS